MLRIEQAQSCALARHLPPLPRRMKDLAMLRITKHESADPTTFQLEGKLAGPWVQELADCWQTTRDGRNKARLCVDLSAMTFIDSAGKELLAAMHSEGAELVCTGCLMKAVVAEITRAPLGSDNGRR